MRPGSTVPVAKADTSSAINDATRLVGGTLGVAVIGSIYTSIYAADVLRRAPQVIPPAALRRAASSVGEGYAVAARAPAGLAHTFLLHTQSAFMSGMHVGCLVAAGVCFVGAIGAEDGLRSRAAVQPRPVPRSTSSPAISG